jgi:hypothetical protein
MNVETYHPLKHSGSGWKCVKEIIERRNEKIDVRIDVILGKIQN